MTDMNLRNVATIERLAKSLLEQCAHYRRNSQQGDDSVRFVTMRIEAADLYNTVALAARRHERSHA